MRNISDDLGKLTMQDVGVGGLGGTGGFSVHHLDAGRSAFLGAPYHVNLVGGIPLEVGGGVFALYHEYQVETLGQFHYIVNFHTDAALGPGGYAGEQGCQ